jgi:tetratricopeptide (TPR) repeat protein
MKKRIFIFILLLFIIGGFLDKINAQHKIIDSLLSLIKKDKEDTGKVAHLNALAQELIYFNPDSTIILARQAVSLAHRISFARGEAKANGYAGIGYYFKSDYQRALENYFAALKIDSAILKDARSITEKKSAQRGISSRLGNIGVIYDEQSDYPTALDYYFKALKIDEEIGDKRGTGSDLGNIGGVYYEQRDFSKALYYYFSALNIAKKLGDKNSIANNLSNIGAVYESRGDSARAAGNHEFTGKLYLRSLDYYLNALDIVKELGNMASINTILGNIGNIYCNQGDNEGPGIKRENLFNKGEEYYLNALKVAGDIEDKNSIAINVTNLGSLYVKQIKYPEAEKCFRKALAINKEVGSKNIEMQIENHFSELYSKTGRFNLALKHYKNYISARDSINNEENTKKQTQLEMNYQFAKQQTADSIKNTEQLKQEQLRHDQKIRQQKTYTYGGVIGFLLMIVVAGVSFRAFKQKQKANEIISLQKLLVEKKQKEILDSIHYAKKIQQSLLPTEKYIDKKSRELKKL